MGNILTNDEKRVLKTIKKLSKTQTYFDSKIDLTNKLSYKYSNSEIDMILDSLYEKGYFDKEQYTKRLKGGRSFIIIHKTKTYNEIAVKEIIRYILNSLFVPAAVALITALITSLVTSGK